jgi:predicted nuclease with TOPRIM domain
VVVIRDIYIDHKTLKEWLDIITTCKDQTIVFLMSKLSETHIPWQEWILAHTQIIGFPFWEETALNSFIPNSKLSPTTKQTIIRIHNEIIGYVEKSQSNFIKVTPMKFLSLAKQTEIVYFSTLSKNKTRHSECITIDKWMKTCKETILLGKEQLKDKQIKLEDVRTKIKQIKKENRLLNDDLEKVKGEITEETDNLNEIKTKEQSLLDKYDQIKNSSFDLYWESVKQLLVISNEEKIAFSKPMLVHEDIEKIANIVMVLFKIEATGWKPYKDKFLSLDWQSKVEGFNPDFCQHTQEFIINKLLADIKTPKNELEKISYISGRFWDFIEGTLKAFSTKFERRKLSDELEDAQKAIQDSIKKLENLSERLHSVEKSISNHNNNFKHLSENQESLEAEINHIEKTVQIKEKFIQSSTFLHEESMRDLNKVSIKDQKILNDVILEQTVYVYLGGFPGDVRMKILKQLSFFEESNVSEETINNVLDILDFTSISSNIIQNLSLITDLRAVFLVDPNDVLPLILQKEIDEIKIVKLVEESDITKIVDYLTEDSDEPILVEDMYYENDAIAHRLLDDYLTKISYLAAENNKFIFFICKTEHVTLPHSAYSQMFFLNLQLSGQEVLRFTTSILNLTHHADSIGLMKNMEQSINDLEKKVCDLQNSFLKLLLSHDSDGITEEFILLAKDLEQQKQNLTVARQDKLNFLNSLKGNKSKLSTLATPVIYALFLMGRGGWCAVPSFQTFCNFSKTIEETDEMMFQIFQRYSFQIPEKCKALMGTYMSLAKLFIDETITDVNLKMFLNILDDCKIASESLQHSDLERVSQESELILKKYSLLNG